MAKWTIVCLLVVLALGGCGSGEAAEVSTAVEAVEAKLRSFSSHSYAGLNAFVATDDLDGARAEFRQRYGDEPIVVDRSARTGIVPVG